MLISLLKQFNIDFCTVVEDNITHIILLLPYLPYKNYPKNVARIDSFYVASNKLYKLAKYISKELEQNGFELVDSHLQLKPLAQKGGLGKILNNQLLVNKKYGSKFTLQGISVVGKFEYSAAGQVEKICDSCHKCDFACPNNALNKGVFTRENCLRHMQDFASEYFEVVGGRVLGCEECQNVCPYNSHIQKIDMPQEIAQIFDYNNIFEMLKGGKKGLAPLSQVIGSNLARPTYIFSLVVNSLLSANNFDYSDIIGAFANHSSQAIRDKVKFYFEKASLATKYNK